MGAVAIHWTCFGNPKLVECTASRKRNGTASLSVLWRVAASQHLRTDDVYRPWGQSRVVVHQSAQGRARRLHHALQRQYRFLSTTRGKRDHARQEDGVEL